MDTEVSALSAPMGRRQAMYILFELGIALFAASHDIRVLPQGGGEATPEPFNTELCPAGRQDGTAANNNSTVVDADFHIDEYLDGEFPGLVKFRGSFEGGGTYTMANILSYLIYQNDPESINDLADEYNGRMVRIGFRHPFLTQFNLANPIDSNSGLVKPVLEDEVLVGTVFELIIGETGLAPYEFTVQPTGVDLDQLVIAMQDPSIILKSNRNLQDAVAQALWHLLGETESYISEFLSQFHNIQLDSIEAVKKAIDWGDVSLLRSIAEVLIADNNFSVDVFAEEYSIADTGAFLVSREFLLNPIDDDDDNDLAPGILTIWAIDRLQVCEN